MQLVRKQVDTTGQSFVLVLHDLNYAARYADYIIDMKQGAVLQQVKRALFLMRNVYQRYTIRQLK